MNHPPVGQVGVSFRGEPGDKVWELSEKLSSKAIREIYGHTLVGYLFTCSSPGEVEVAATVNICALINLRAPEPQFANQLFKRKT